MDGQRDGELDDALDSASSILDIGVPSGYSNTVCLPEIGTWNICLDRVVGRKAGCESGAEDQDPGGRYAHCSGNHVHPALLQPECHVVVGDPPPRTPSPSHLCLSCPVRLPVEGCDLEGHCLIWEGCKVSLYSVPVWASRDLNSLPAATGL